MEPKQRVIDSTIHREEEFSTVDELEHGIEKDIIQEEKWYVQLYSVTEGEPVTEDTLEPVLRRSERERQPPTYYREWASMSNMSKETHTYKVALASSDGTKWQKAMATESESLRANDVWDLVELPRDRKAVRSKRVFNMSKEPHTYKVTLASSNGTKWQKAMATESESLRANDVWDLVELPRDRKAVGSK